MANKKITDLTPASALTGAELLEAVQSAASVKVLASAIKTYVNKNVVSAVTIASGVANIDLALGDYFTVAMSENITSLTFTNLPGSGYGVSKTLKITQHASAAKTFAMPSSFKWAGGTTGVISTTLSAVDRLTLVSDDNGTTYTAVLAKDIK